MWLHCINEGFIWRHQQLTCSTAQPPVRVLGLNTQHVGQPYFPGLEIILAQNFAAKLVSFPNAESRCSIKDSQLAGLLVPSIWGRQVSPSQLQSRNHTQYLYIHNTTSGLEMSRLHETMRWKFCRQALSKTISLLGPETGMWPTSSFWWHSC